MNYLEFRYKMRRFDDGICFCKFHLFIQLNFSYHLSFNEKWYFLPIISYSYEIKILSYEIKIFYKKNDQFTFFLVECKLFHFVQVVYFEVSDVHHQVFV